jgi:hypothetical protein
MMNYYAVGIGMHGGQHRVFSLLVGTLALDTHLKQGICLAIGKGNRYGIFSSGTFHYTHVMRLGVFSKFNGS